jgi:hypothetical protein
MPTKETQEEKQTLPAGHPQAGYTAPALDGEQGTGTLPDNEQEWQDERVKGQQEENDAVAEAEDKAAKAEAEASAKVASDKEQADAKAKATVPKPPSRES